MDEEKAHYYSDLKAAVLLKFDISPETYQQQFGAMNVPSGENPTETYHRLKVLCTRCQRFHQTCTSIVAAQGGQDGDQSVALKGDQLFCLNPAWGR